MEEIAKENYCITYSWMDKLGLRQTAIRVYAVIYGFTKNGQSWHGSCSTLAEYAGTTRRSIMRALSCLAERGLIERIGVKCVGSGRPIVEYKALRPDGECDELSLPMCQDVTFNVTNSHVQCDKMAHNNINNNKDDNKEIRINIPSSRGLTARASEADAFLSASFPLEGMMAGRFGELKNEASVTPEKKAQAVHAPAENRQEKNRPEKNRPEKKCADNAAFEAEFEELWALYPRKQGRADALKAYIRSRRGGTAAETVRSGIERYKSALDAGGVEPRFIKQGGNWFIGRCWEDSPPAYERSYAAGARARNRALNYKQRQYTREDLKRMGISLGEEIYGDEDES